MARQGRHRGVARRLAAELSGGRTHCRCRRGRGVSAADRDSLFLHPRTRGFRLSAACCVPARSLDGRSWPVRTIIHSAAVELRLRDSRHHGRAHDRQSARPAGNDHDCPAHDVFGTPSRLRTSDRRLYSAARGVGLFRVAGARAVRLVPGRSRRRACGCLAAQAFHEIRAPGQTLDDGATELSLAGRAQYRHRLVAACRDIHAKSRRHHPRADRLAVVPRELSGATGRRHRTGD